MVHLKLDEDMPRLVRHYLTARDRFEISTVQSQNMRGIDDRSLAQRCKEEAAILVTLDADLLKLRPHDYGGIIVLRLGTDEKSTVLMALQKHLPHIDLSTLPGRTLILTEHNITTHTL